MNYVFFAVAAYIFMRAFEVIFADQQKKQWYKNASKIIGIVVLYTAICAMVVFYFTKLRLLGFSAE
ncbi:MAG: hypothetical protein MUP30_11460 [Deltaproteobacteria bacterium]|jgi:hypothetical protein|nr:hypothetical protein [Deltaproteobacteria bacterium]